MEINLRRLLRSAWMVLLIHCLAINLSSAQSDNFNTIVPPSPRSREFEKFINYKVSLYNGLPEININFYTIELDGVSIPIGLSYHASGIKYKQTSGDVGLGWVLNPGYRVTRTMHGRVDEASTMPDMNNMPGGTTIGSYLSGFTSLYDRDRYLARYLNLRPGGDVPAVAASQYDYLDGEYDMFTIGLPDQSGNFIITDRLNRVTTVLDNGALPKIDYTLNSGTINTFSLTDRNGIQYKLGENDQNRENLQVYVDGAYRKYSSAWMMSEITTLFNRKINFQYQSITESREGMPGYSRTLTEGMFLDNCSRSQGGPVCYPTSDNLGREQLGSITNYETKVLSGITTPNEQVTVTRNGNGTISAISVTGKNGSQLKKVSFSYSQYGSNIFLESVSIAGVDNVAVEKYVFDYTSREWSFDNYDGFGYYIKESGKGFRYALPYDSLGYWREGINPFLNITDPDGNPTPGCGPPPLWLYMNFQGQDKKAINISDAGMLKKITYPTGGTQSFVYEPNQYAVDDYPGNRNGGGFRIYSITSDDAVKGTAITRRYYYGKGNRAFDPANPKFYMSENVDLSLFWCGGGANVVSLRRTTQSSVLPEALSEALSQPNDGWYNEVTEDYGEGKVTYKFGLLNQDPGIGVYPTTQNYSYHQTTVTPRFPAYYIPTYHYWNKPCLLEKTVYKGTVSGSFTPVQKENYEYYVPVFSPVAEVFTGLKIMPFTFSNEFGAANTATPVYDLYTLTGINSVFNYATYKITKSDILLKKKSVTDYDAISGNEIKVTSDYAYTFANMIASEKVTNSNGEVHITNYKYPFNYVGLGTADNLSAGVRKLQDVNLVNTIVEKSIYKANLDGTAKRLVASNFYAYKPGLPVPDGVLKVEADAPILNFSESTVGSGSIVKDNSYKEYLKFDQYDSRGNILQRSKTNDVKEVYIWGYDSKYPVAKIIGSDYATASQFVDQVKLDSAASYTEAEIRAELNKLRTNLPQALVQTYTYRPLIGVSSETDATGRITYYEYDTYGRLKVIRGNDNNILRQFDYQYQTTIEPLYVNTIRNQSFTRNNCTVGHGSTVTYTVPAGRYSSTVSQADADQKAQDDINLNGQSYANTYGVCEVYYNLPKSGMFVKSNCVGDQIGERVVYVVPAGKYTSDISQADADQKANNDVNLNGQTYANANGRCFPPVYAKLKYENIVQTQTTTKGDVVVRFYSDTDCTIPVTLSEGPIVHIKITTTTTPDNTVTEAFELFSTRGSSTVLKSNTFLSERTSPAPGAPATNYTFTLQSGYGYTIR